MKTVKGMPITASRSFTSKKAPFVPDAKDTSADEQTMIAEAPSPFKNRNQAGSGTTATGASGGISTNLPRIASGLQHSSPGARALPSGGPVGQRRPINQSAAVNGRMGTRFPSKVGGADLKSKYPSKRGAAFYGE